MLPVIQLLMSFSPYTTNMLHITAYNGRFQILLKLLDQISIFTPPTPFCDEIFEKLTIFQYGGNRHGIS